MKILLIPVFCLIMDFSKTDFFESESSGDSFINATEIYIGSKDFIETDKIGLLDFEILENETTANSNIGTDESAESATTRATIIQGEDSFVKNPIRQTIYGPIKGYLHEEKGILAEVYTRVRYGKAPVGQLRFQSPEPPDRWTEVQDATVSPPYCIQFWYPDPRITHRDQSEDCLFLNVFVPKNYSKPGPYAVVVWTHGGSFTVNGANMFPMEGIVRNLVSEGIIFITINYRLGPFGFLSTLNAELHGNYGLEDQILALKWVQNNIKNFNGDPNRVVYGGESAGAASVSLLALSPRAEGLFQRAITRSGSSLAPWAVRSTNTDLNSLLLIKWTGCSGYMPKMKAVRECLQAVPIENLTNIWAIIGNNDLMYIISGKKHREVNYNHPFLAHTYFTPVVDAFRQNDSVIPAYPKDMMKTKIRMPLMTGVTTGECAAYVSWLYFLKSSSVPIELNDMEYVVPHVIYANPEQIKQAVYSNYIANHAENIYNYGKALINIASDQNFISHVVMEADLYAKAHVPVYTYIFDHNKDELDGKHHQQGIYDCKNIHNFLKKLEMLGSVLVGASHGYDMVFMVQSTGAIDPVAYPVNWTSADLFMTEFLARSVANWAKYGNPSKRDLPAHWPQYREECGTALLFAPSPDLVKFYPESKRFWHETVPIIDQLTFEKGYQYHNPVKCVEECPLDFKVAFLVSIIVGILLILAICMMACMQWIRKQDSYAVVSNCSSTPIVSV